jgi:hypothetical protein
VHKREVFSQAMKAGLFKKLAWLIGAFSMVTDDAQRWEADKYAWRIVQLTSGNYVVLPDETLALIEDAPRGVPVFDFNDEVEVTPEDIPNCKQALTSTYGNWFTNWLVLVTPFGTKIDYMEGDITPPRIEAILLKNFWDNPKSKLEEKPDRFYVREYEVYVRAVFFLTGLTQLCVWAATRKTLLPAPGIRELRDKLIEENKDHLNELATIAKIDSELVKHDLAYLKGDPGMNFLRGGKAIDVVRKKKFAMVGAETGLDENTVYGTLIKSSLTEGWEIDKFPIMNDTLRAGSFNRGAQTQLGGVSVKWLLRASSNMNIAGDDCGSKKGISFAVTEKNKIHLVGFTLTDGKKDTKIASVEEAGAYLGQIVAVRSPMYCRLLYTDFCKTCLGDRLSVNLDGLSIAMSEYGSQILSMFLAAMHGKKLATARMDYKTAIS